MSSRILLFCVQGQGHLGRRKGNLRVYNLLGWCFVFVGLITFLQAITCTDSERFLFIYLLVDEVKGETI